MKCGMYDTKGNFHELYFYKIQELCEVMTKAAIDGSEEFKHVFQEKYVNKVTRFSPYFEFCIHELGWMLYDPFCLGNDEVLFSNGNRTYIASTAYIQNEGFDRHNVQNDKIGYPVLTDELIKYNEELSTIEGIGDGIVDERGYVSSHFLPSLNDLAQIELMFDLINNEEMYNDYITHKEEYPSVLDYVTSKKNVISIKKIEDGRYSLGFVSENDGKVQNFIDALNASGKLADLKPLVQNEARDVMKVA